MACVRARVRGRALLPSVKRCGLDLTIDLLDDCMYISVCICIFLLLEKRHHWIQMTTSIVSYILQLSIDTRYIRICLCTLQVSATSFH